MSGLGSRYMAIDPGGTCGFAIFDEATGVPLGFGEVKRGPEFFDLLESENVGLYVVENWRVRPSYDKGKKMNSWSPYWDEALTARDIGAVEYHAYRTGRVIHIQEPSIKSTASKWYGLPNDSSHQMNAMLHGVYYATKELGIAPPIIQEGRSDSDRPRVRRPARVAQISSYAGLRKARSKASVEVQEPPT
jgi:hypothetical protein